MNQLLNIRQLSVDFQTPDGPLNAVNKVDLQIGKGEVVCLVGESGSGKTITSLSIMRLIDYNNGSISHGEIELDGLSINALSKAKLSELRGKKVSMIFQEPMTALDPVFTIGHQITEVIRRHRAVTPKQAQAEALELLRRVGIPEPEIRLKQYPYELSGGMRQRAMIAIALACGPELLIADEPTTALDVTIQAQIIHLLQELRTELGMSILLITHDLGVAAELGDRIVVMYAGKIVEQAGVHDLFEKPAHPYTHGLLQSVVTLENDRSSRLYTIDGTIPNLSELPSGCRFHPRCPHATDRCRTEEPPLAELGGREAACWHAEKLLAEGFGGSAAGTAEAVLGFAAEPAPVSAAGGGVSTGEGESLPLQEAVRVGEGFISGKTSAAGQAANGEAEGLSRIDAEPARSRRSADSGAAADGQTAWARDAASQAEFASGSAASGETLLEVKSLRKYFPLRGGLLQRSSRAIRAVDDVSFDIRRGETFGLVGESGCGKSTLGRVLLQLEKATGGQVLFEGRDLLGLGHKQRKEARRDMQIVFQDPYGSINPRWKVGNIIGEPFTVHESLRAGEQKEKVQEVMRLVGLNPSWYDRYPHEFSGGQRQRIGIARAIALNPKFVLADEAVSALDVSVQSQVVNLLQDLQERLGLTYLFIAHGLNIVRHISDRIGVMYLGKLVEIATAEELFHHPAHHYTKALLAAIPVPDPKQRKAFVPIEGEMPSPANPPSGCRFHTRCPAATSRCRSEAPELREVGPGHLAACHYPL